MSALSISCFIFVWLFMSLASINRGIARKTGLTVSPYRKVYLRQRYNANSVENFLAAVLGNMNKGSKLNISFGFKLKFVFLGENIGRVCSDFVTAASYYLMNFHGRNLRISLDHSSANYIFALLNTLMSYDVVFRRMTNQASRSPDSDIVIRYSILRYISSQIGIHPIEWYLSDPVIKAMTSKPKPFALTLFHHALAKMLMRELKTLSDKARYDGLALALKTVFYSHSEYQASLSNLEINRIGVLKNQKFIESDLVEIFQTSLRWVDLRNRKDLVTSLSMDSDDALVFNCGRYLVLPVLSKAVISYTKLSQNLITHIGYLANENIDISLWFSDYFSKVKDNYILFDTYDPSLSFQDRFFDLKKDEWGESTKALHSVFIEQMDGLFNDKEQRAKL